MPSSFANLAVSSHKETSVCFSLYLHSINKLSCITSALVTLPFPPLKGVRIPLKSQATALALFFHALSGIKFLSYHVKEASVSSLTSKLEDTP